MLRGAAPPVSLTTWYAGATMVPMADRRPYRCPRCETLLTVAQTISVQKWWPNVKCRECNNLLDIYSVKVDLLPSCERFLTDETVLKTQWHHSTYRKDWHNDVLNSPEYPIVHLGTYQAAEARARDIQDRPVWEMKYRFVVRLKKDATIDPEVLEDVDEWDDSAALYNYDVTRYVNRFESPGSVSLLAKPDAFTVIRVFEKERELQDEHVGS